MFCRDKIRRNDDLQRPHIGNEHEIHVTAFVSHKIVLACLLQVQVNYAVNANDFLLVTLDCGP